MSIKNLIITPYNSNIKYYYKNSKIFFSSNLINSLSFPYNSGVFENTISISNNILKSIIVYKKSLAPNTYININIIGGFTYSDERGFHDRILTMPENSNSDIFEISSFLLDEIKNFFIMYNKTHARVVTFFKFYNKKDAQKIYNDSSVRFYKKLEI